MNIKLILKGFVVGIGKIIPGVSGAVLAIAMGIYEKVIMAIVNFFDDIKNNSKLLFNFFLGVMLAIVLFSRGILFLLNNYYLETMYLFLGLIVGTLLNFINDLKMNKKNGGLFGIFLVLTLLLNGIKRGTLFSFKGTLLHYLYTAFLGFIDAVTAIVPGISGTAIYMLLGSYEYVLEVLANPFSLKFGVYGLGLVGGVIIVCIIMNYLLQHKKEETYSVIAAFMVGSTGILLFNVMGTFNLMLGIFLIVGIGLGLVLQK